MITLWRLIAFAWKDFWRNLWLSFVTIVMIVIALLAVNVLILFNVMTEKTIQSVEEKVDIALYFKPGVIEEDVTHIQEELQKDEGIKAVTYTSAEEALQQFRERHKDNTTILESLSELDENPLGARLTIQAKNPDVYETLISKIEGADYNHLIQNKNFSNFATIIDRVNAFTGKVRRGVLLLVALFSLIALLIVYNTIRVSIYTHRDEIGIMKLVGATNRFIRLPFIFLGIGYTTIALLITSAILYPVILFGEQYLQGFFEGIPIELLAYVHAYGLVLLFVEFIVATALTMLSSAIAVGKYVKV